MTMHIVRGMTSLNTRKRQSKIDVTAMEADWRAYNKDMRRQGLSSMQFATLESFIDFRLGRGKKVKSTSSASVKVNVTHPKPFVRETAHIPSLKADVSGNFAAKKEVPKYTGDYMVGIATMHKSNLVPVGKDDSPINYSTMRRS